MCLVNFTMNAISVIISILLLSFLPSKMALADELADLLGQVETLNISRNDYTLGKVLADRQKKTARQNAIEKARPGTYKFKDKDLYVVTHQTTNRVLILYEHYEPASRKKVRELVGALFFDFGEPTVMAHDKTIYWAFDAKGKLSEKEYRQAKAKRGQLNILATVKLNSSETIMENSRDFKDGSVYYIISSEPVLKLIKAQGE